jgi:NAD(P)-dependent dehydrogenase (short-subunit alcohol dehydrogenase family)
VTGRLAGKVALVTSAARGIGRACALAFVREGADLVLLDIARDIPEVGYPLGTAGQLAHTAGQCRELGSTVWEVQADLRDPTAVEHAVSEAVARFGVIDTLVNNAGVIGPAGKPVHEHSESEWELMIAINLTGAWRMIRAVGALMVRQRRGSVINMASTGGVVGYPRFAGYVAAEHGLVGLTKAAALDFAPHGVRVNALCPGSVRDDQELEGRMLSEIGRCLAVDPAKHENIFAQQQPGGALVEVHDVAGAAVWLATDESRHATGSIVTIDGAFTAR